MSSADLTKWTEEDIIGWPLPAVRIAPHSIQYGARYLAAYHCGFDAPPCELPGEWQHGWLPEHQNYHPEAIVGTNGLSRHTRRVHHQFVARRDQEEALRSFGYEKAHAIGHPLVYLKTPHVERLPRSLLVMPVHSLGQTEHAWDFDEYADIITALRGQFDKVVVCVSPHCFEKGYWVDAFQARGFEVIRGADFMDVNAYHRLAVLFQRFEFTTTNGHGSHLAYAQYFGSKTSVYGPFPIYHREDFENTLIYQNCPELLDHNFRHSHQELIQSNWPWLLVEPWKAISKTDWAQQQLGADCKRTPRELAQLFDWSPSASRMIRRKAHAFAKWGGQTARTMSLRIFMRKKHAAFKLLKEAGALVPGQEMMFPVLGEPLMVSNGPIAAMEYDFYHLRRAGSTYVNPPDAPLVDFIGGDGVALACLVRKHGYRTIHAWACTDDLLARNSALWPRFHFHTMDPEPAMEQGCCGKLAWIKEQLSRPDGCIPRDTGVMRISCCPKCMTDLGNIIPKLEKISLLLVEWLEPIYRESAIGPIAAMLNEQRFSILTRTIFHSANCIHAKKLDHHRTIFSAIRYGESQRSSTLD